MRQESREPCRFAPLAAFVVTVLPVIAGCTSGSNGGMARPGDGGHAGHDVATDTRPSRDASVHDGDARSAGGDSGQDARDANDGDAPASIPCGAPCVASGGSCLGGGCVCGDGDTSCANVCVDELEDPGNCGGCGLACAGTCSNGECQVTLASTESAVALAVDDTTLYWVNATGSVVKVATAGGSTTTLATGQGSPQAIALDDAGVYFTTGGGDVARVPKAGGPPLTLASGQTGALGLSVTNGRVYWGANRADAGAILSAPISGAVPPALVVTSTGPVYGVVTDSSNVYWTTGDGLYSAPLAPSGTDGGAAASSLGTPGSSNVALAVNPTNIYWGTFGSGTGSVQGVGVFGGSSYGYASNQDGPNGLVCDLDFLWWTTEEGLVLKTERAGGVPFTLASSATPATGIALDTTTVYWASGPTVQKVTPK